jgi:hypothetical protein
VIRSATALLALLLACAQPARSAPIVFVPLDDRPVTLQLPLILGQIAGRPVVAPPRALLGSYLQAGAPDAIVAWLNATAPAGEAYVLSSDMLAYGGLVASRVPGVRYADAYQRLREIDRLRARRSGAWIGVFGTIMRLAPTGVPAIGPGATFFAAYPAWTYLQEYANLHDPLLPSEVTRAAQLRVLLGEPLLDAYLHARARDYGINRLLIDRVRAGSIDRLVLGQDDAKPYGLHVPEVSALEADLDASDLDGRASIEPGADELGMALVAHALARDAGWRPRVAVHYSRPDGAAYQDPLEYEPIGTTIDRIIALCGATHDDADPQIVLYVHLPESGGALDDAFTASLPSDLAARRSIALVDLSFEGSYTEQAAFAHRLLANGVASRLDAYAAWNTDANSVGTALAEAIAAGAGRRMGTYDALAHRTFTFMRFLDDVDFHDDVRPTLNAWLDANGIPDHTLLAPDIAAQAAERNRELIWYDAQATLAQLYPGLHIAAMNVTLPWDRTFETAVDVRLANSLP